MARKKVNLQWISNSSTRRAAYKKRCQGLMKKTSDLATLCGIKACVLVYGEGEAQPEVWPSAPEAMRVLKKFKAMPDIARFKKMQTQEDFIQCRIAKLRDQVSKLDLVNREHETKRLLHESMVGRRPGLVDTNAEELASLREMVEMKMAKVKELLQQQVVTQGGFPNNNHPASSSSTQPQAFSYAEPQQAGWPTDLALAEGELLGDMVSNVFASTSKDCAGPSGGDNDMTQPYNLGDCSGSPWTQDVYTAME
ncbi:unnamed protein product [Urochloa humidicola]